MCGIYGVINRKVRREQAMECLDTMIHRGPDGFGLWQEGWCDARSQKTGDLRSLQRRKPADVLRQ